MLRPQLLSVNLNGKVAFNAHILIFLCQESVIIEVRYAEAFAFILAHHVVVALINPEFDQALNLGFKRNDRQPVTMVNRPYDINLYVLRLVHHGNRRFGIVIPDRSTGQFINQVIFYLGTYQVCLSREKRHEGHKICADGALLEQSLNRSGSN